MNKYRLKKEAVPFFKEDLATQIMDLAGWKHFNVDEKALEKVEPMYVTYGNEKRGYTSLSGWSAEDGSRFEFTVHFPSVKFIESDKFMKGKVTRRLMDKIQSEINYFYEEFLNESK